VFDDYCVTTRAFCERRDTFLRICLPAGRLAVVCVYDFLSFCGRHSGTSKAARGNERQFHEASKASELERQELNHKLRLLYRENKILQSKVESSDSAANIRPLLNIARIDNHVIRMTKDRIEHDRCLDKRAAARREASWSQRLRHAALDRHVRTLTQGRLEYAAGDERAASAARQTQADLQIRQHSETIASTRCRLKRSILDLHVKSKLAERLEDTTRDQVRQIEELSDQIHSIKSSVRTQSQQALAQKLQHAEQEIDGLRRLQQRMLATDSSTTDCLESLATIVDPARLRNGHS
jgi:hypothetical protein